MSFGWIIFGLDYALTPLLHWNSDCCLRLNLHPNLCLSPSRSACSCRYRVGFFITFLLTCLWTSYLCLNACLSLLLDLHCFCWYFKLGWLFCLPTNDLLCTFNVFWCALALLWFVFVAIDDLYLFVHWVLPGSLSLSESSRTVLDMLNWLALACWCFVIDGWLKSVGGSSTRLSITTPANLSLPINLVWLLFLFNKVLVA